MFDLTKEQNIQALKWVEEKLKDNRYQGAIGGRFTFQFTPTSLGCVVTVVDNITKSNIDVTDYDSW